MEEDEFGGLGRADCNVGMSLTQGRVESGQAGLV